jgi:hypothetical protein
MEDAFTTSPIIFVKSGKILYLIDSRKRNTSALFALNMETHEQTLIAEDRRADVSDGLWEFEHSDRGAVIVKSGKVHNCPID